MNPHTWPDATPPICKIILAKNHPERFTLTLIKDGKMLRQGTWKSKNKISDEINKAGAKGLSPKIPWPKFFGDSSVITVPNPTRWYWFE